MDRLSTEGALDEAPKAPRGVGCTEGPHPARERFGNGASPPTRIFVIISPQSGAFWCCI